MLARLPVLDASGRTLVTPNSRHMPATSIPVSIWPAAFPRPHRQLGLMPPPCTSGSTCLPVQHHIRSTTHSIHRRQRSSSLRCRGTISGDSAEVSLSQLQQQLEQAIEDEDYEMAAQLRDTLQRRRFDARLAVEEANERFYAAFQSGSLSAMADVWGSGEHVQCIHPLSGCIAGRQLVMESWKMILGAGRMRISLEDVRVFASDNHGFVTCLEITETEDRKGRIVATNVFEKQGGVWKIVHHHGSPVPPGAR